MRQDPVGKSVLASASESVKLPSDAGFMAADGSEYAAYRQFYASAPAELR
jgi:phosphonate transport system substrate-binding protein